MWEPERTDFFGGGGGGVGIEEGGRMYVTTDMKNRSSFYGHCLITFLMYVFFLSGMDIHQGQLASQ